MEVSAAMEMQDVGIFNEIKAYMANNRMSIASLAKEIGYSRTAISQYLSGKYDSDATEIEVRLSTFLDEKSGVNNKFKVLNTPAVTKMPTFFESNDAKAIIGVCQSAQEYIGLGIVVGRTGYGKTYSLKYYAKLPKVAYIECDDTMGCRDLVKAIERALGIPTGYGSIWERVGCIRDFCNANKGYLIIVDEADKLVSKYTQKKMEILRAIYDQSDVGIVIAGEPKLEVQLKSYIERMANRIDFYASLGGLCGKEVEEFLQSLDIEDGALEELKSRAYGSRSGCFRLLDRTLSNVFRVIKDEGQTITSKTIEKASGIMML
ncbi:MAG: AAA family ATPase [Oscillospiraceae bacterium]